MKIPLKFINNRLILPTTVQLKRGFGQVEFYVDTGSTNTFVGVGDAIRLNIPVDSFKFKSNSRMGGESLALHEMNNSTIYCRDEQEKLFSLLNNEPLLVAKNLRTSQTAIVEAQSFPSLLGIDILLKHKLILYFDPANNRAYLEKKE